MSQAGVPFPGGSAEPCLPPRRAHPCAPASPAPAGPADGGRGEAFHGSRRVSHAGPWALPPLLTPSRPRTEPLRPAGGRAAPRLAPARPGPAQASARPGPARGGGGCPPGPPRRRVAGPRRPAGAFPRVGKGPFSFPLPAKHKKAAALPLRPEGWKRGGCLLPRGHPTGPRVGAGLVPLVPCP